jgi:hypothetical protein
MIAAIHLSDCRPEIVAPGPKIGVSQPRFSVSTVGSVSFHQRFRASTIGKYIHPDLRIPVALQPLPFTSTFSVTRGKFKTHSLRQCAAA